jgi:hypothetical protein
MRRSIHIAITLLAVLLLLKPFDCFGSGQFTQKAADCCKKGKCVPSSNADDCCKGTLPGGKQLAVSKASHHAPPVLEIAETVPDGVIAPALRVAILSEAPVPLGSPPSSRLNLPLLI